MKGQRSGRVECIWNYKNGISVATETSAKNQVLFIFEPVHENLSLDELRSRTE